MQYERSSIDRQTDKRKKTFVKASTHRKQMMTTSSYTAQNSIFYTLNVNTSNFRTTIISYYYFWDDGDVSGNLWARILE